MFKYRSPAGHSRPVMLRDWRSRGLGEHHAAVGRAFPDHVGGSAVDAVVDRAGMAAIRAPASGPVATGPDAPHSMC